MEVKKTKSPVGEATARDFLDKLRVFAALHTDKRLVPAFFSTGCFTDEALRLFADNGIATADEFTLDLD